MLAVFNCYMLVIHNKVFHFGTLKNGNFESMVLLKQPKNFDIYKKIIFFHDRMLFYCTEEVLTSKSPEVQK